MNIVLIYPNWLEKGRLVEDPLGILYIAAVLRRAGHMIKTIDLVFEKSAKTVKERSVGADLIGVYSTSSMFHKATVALREAKKASPSALSVLGGPHALFMTEEALDAGFDYAVLGEGEKTIIDFVKALSGGSQKGVKGIAYKREGRLIVNERQAFIDDLDSIPFPARSLWNYKKYRKYSYNMAMMATRGCPYHCLFCQPAIDKIFGKKLRRRSAPNVVEEIEEVAKNYHNPLITFKDDNFLLCGLEWFDDFSRLLKKRRLKVRWTCCSRADTIREDVLKIMKEAGCQAVNIGIESGSQKVLDFYQKGIKVEDTIRAFDICHRLGLMTHAYLMLGAPVETEKDLQKTCTLIEKVRPYSWRLQTFTPMPGSGLFNESIRANMLPFDNEVPYDGLMNNKKDIIPLKLKFLTRKKIIEYSRKMHQICVWINIKRVFSSWRDLWRAVKYSKWAVLKIFDNY